MSKLKIGFLGAGSWGFALACHLARAKHEVVSWTPDAQLAKGLNEGMSHPSLKGHFAPKNLRFTSNLSHALLDVDLLCESVTSEGIRPVFTQVKSNKAPLCPIVLTSKGIEQDSQLNLSDVVIEILGEKAHSQIGYLSGPSFATDVISELPTSVVAAAYTLKTAQKIANAFATPSFRVYTSLDVKGVSYGGALKNIIAIACGIASGMGLGQSAIAALMTRGLHEMAKLAIACGAQKETLYGLSGMGDLCLTCTSTTSRNFQFGTLLAKGLSADLAKEQIAMAVEGAYTTKSAFQLAEKLSISMPITEAVYKIIYENANLKETAKNLMNRPLKEEVL